MKLPIFQIDAFTDKLFAGNPAAICPLESWLPDELLQSIAAENNLAETAYFVREQNGYHLRWFTPAVEVGLCGHATLAAAWVIMNELDPQARAVNFRSLGGPLMVHRTGDLYTLDFPASKPVRLPASTQLEEAFGTPILEVWGARDVVALLDSEQTVVGLTPDFERLKKMEGFGFVATAASSKYDFVSRFFAPSQGINEDPVTGSAHCTLAPFWADRLGRNSLRAFQASPRGGEVLCEVKGARVELSGYGVKYMEGTISL